MATNRSRRLRKKLCVDKFRAGFPIELPLQRKAWMPYGRTLSCLRFIDQAIRNPERNLWRLRRIQFTSARRAVAQSQKSRALIRAWLEAATGTGQRQGPARWSTHWYAEQPVCRALAVAPPSRPRMAVIFPTFDLLRRYLARRRRELPALPRHVGGKWPLQYDSYARNPLTNYSTRSGR